MKFFLGTTEPSWLEQSDVPLFISARRLRQRRPKTLPKAVVPWALDSGGFTELNLYGKWSTPPEVYAAEVRRWMLGIGMMQWAAPQDWMCESFMLAKTGLRISDHQLRTVENFIELRELAPDVPWVPVLQGWALVDYQRCADAYEARGVDLASLPVVGLGSVCRRQATGEARNIVTALAARGYKLHGFGFKLGGLEECGRRLESADSLAWSYHARREPPMAGHTHKNCNTCLPFAKRWYHHVIRTIARGERQLELLSC